MWWGGFLIIINIDSDWLRVSSYLNGFNGFIGSLLVFLHPFFTLILQGENITTLYPENTFLIQSTTVWDFPLYCRVDIQEVVLSPGII